MKEIVILLPEDEIEFLSENEIIELEKPAHENRDNNANFFRAIHWLTNCDCAIVTAWRGEKSRQVNDENNKELLKSLLGLGYGVTKVRGCYPEVGKGTTHENSFLVFCDEGDDRDAFIANIFDLAEKYEQDNFLFKPAGPNEAAYYIGTNDDFGKHKRKTVGKLHIGSMSADAYTRIGAGKIVFTA